MDCDVEQRLVRLAETLDAPREDGGREATLTALMPCEPVVGEVVVACWQDSDGGELVELVRFDDGSRVHDQAALREALTLLAMVETVEELASFDELQGMIDSLDAWSVPEGLDADAGALAPAQERARARVAALASLAPTEVRVARTQHLDALGAALRELEAAWTELERHAEAWSDALLAASGDDPAAVAAVRSLWEALGTARRGPLARPISTALHEGREAGASMAAAVASA
ncbi:MAG: hypothetical protein KDC46_04625 [Thermoleophilia bacterium]|nr:hypothetical protein [Thermoleophilia bacterium]